MRRASSIAKVIIAASCFGFAAAEARAQAEYPARPIRLIVGFAPGGGTDIVARILGQKLDEGFGQQRMVIENRPGASQILASELVARSAPDGYTIIMVAGAFTVTPALRRKLPFDTVRDFAPIAMVARAPNILVVHPSVPARSIKDLVSLARARPAQLTYGSSGVGGPSHLSGILMGVLAKVELVHIPYKGSGQALIDLVSGNIHMAFPTISGAVPHLKSGRLIPLGVTTRQRSALVPTVPTIEESGLQGYEASSWFGLLGPAGIARPIVARLNESLNKVLKDPAMREALALQGAEAVGGTPEEFAATIAAELVKWKKLVEDGGIKPE